MPETEKAGQDINYHITGLINAREIHTFRELIPDSLGDLPADGRFVIGAYDTDGPCGVCIYEFTGYVYEILFIGVHPRCRRRGVATLMLQRMLASLYDMNMVFPVRIMFEADEGADAIRNFILSQGNFFFTDPDLSFRLTGSERKKSRLYKQLLNRKSKAVPYFEQTEYLRSAFVNEQHRRGLWFLDAGKLPEDVYDRALSFCFVSEGRIRCVALMKKMSDDFCELSYLYVQPNRPIMLLEVLAGTVRAMEIYCPKADLLVQTVNAASQKLLRGLFAESIMTSDNIENAVWDLSLKTDGTEN